MWGVAAPPRLSCQLKCPEAGLLSTQHDDAGRHCSVADSIVVVHARRREKEKWNELGCILNCIGGSSISDLYCAGGTTTLSSGAHCHFAKYPCGWCHMGGPFSRAYPAQFFWVDDERSPGQSKTPRHGQQISRCKPQNPQDAAFLVLGVVARATRTAFGKMTNLGVTALEHMKAVLGMQRPRLGRRPCAVSCAPWSGFPEQPCDWLLFICQTTADADVLPVPTRGEKR